MALNNYWHGRASRKWKTKGWGGGWWFCASIEVEGTNSIYSMQKKKKWKKQQLRHTHWMLANAMAKSCWAWHQRISSPHPSVFFFLFVNWVENPSATSNIPALALYSWFNVHSLTNSNTHTTIDLSDANNVYAPHIRARQLVSLSRARVWHIWNKKKRRPLFFFPHTFSRVYHFSKAFSSSIC